MSNQYPAHVQLEEPLEHQNINKDEQVVVELLEKQDMENQLPTIENGDNDIIRIMRNYGQPYPRNFGKYCIFKFKDNEPTIAIGPHWPLFLFSYAVLAFAGFKLIEYSSLYFSAVYTMISVAVTALLLVSYMTTALLNPGIASAQYQILNEQDIIGQKRYCKPCQILRPKGTTHCFDCDVCIKEYDHHCPWTGKCIGQGNIQIFYIFIMSVMTFMIYSILLVFSKI